ncbi:MAG: ABC transporter permease subunit [Spirochaetaceae bacterium]|jgi:NitT/TauT family transport system permease protein|nr:ABC transporter permease subunit [Spirochaetaceae bacterium]
MNKKKASSLWFCSGIAVFLGIWKLAALLLDSEIILPSPEEAVKRLIVLIPTPVFLKSLAASFARVMTGLLLAAPLGIATGLAAGINRRFDFFMRPFFTLIAATPVMSIILIVFLWAGSELTPVITAFLMVFPLVASNTREAVCSLDERLLELFSAFNMSRSEYVRYLYIPHAFSYISAALKSSLSFSWKAVAAAEVLVQPVLAIGTGMQTAKANLETAGLFAWTIAAVIAANLCEFLFSAALKTVPKTVFPLHTPKSRRFSSV